MSHGAVQNYTNFADAYDRVSHGEDKVYTAVHGTIVGAQQGAADPTVASTPWGPHERFFFQPDAIQPNGDAVNAKPMGVSMNLSQATADFGTPDAHKLKGQPMDINVGDQVIVRGELTHGLHGGFCSDQVMMHWTHFPRGGVEDTTSGHSYT